MGRRRPERPVGPGKETESGNARVVGDTPDRETLLADVWGITADVTTRTVDTHIKRLREKLGPGGDVIETTRDTVIRRPEYVQKFVDAYNGGMSLVQRQLNVTKDTDRATPLARGELDGRETSRDRPRRHPRCRAALTRTRRSRVRHRSSPGGPVPAHR